MNYNAESEAEWLASLAPAARAYFFAILSHNLTIVVRVLCHGAADAPVNLERIRALNEAHHRVSSYLSHFHGGDEDPGWVKVVVEYVLSSSDPVVHQQAAQAWQHSKVAALGRGAA